MFEDLLRDPNWNQKLIKTPLNIRGVNDLINVTELGIQEPLLITSNAQARHGFIQLAKKFSGHQVNSCVKLVGAIS